jgi:lariat debranching enzyme
MVQLTPRPRHTSRAIADDVKGKGRAVDQDSDREPPVDIFMSHDWPVTITRYGDEAALLRKKSFFAEEVGPDLRIPVVRSLLKRPYP